MNEEQELTTARLAVNDWHACATNDELARWRAAQARLIIAAKASVYPDLEALREERNSIAADRDALRAQLAASRITIEQKNAKIDHLSRLLESRGPSGSATDR